MAFDAGRYLTARPDGHGGVTLTPRFRFRDQPSAFLPKSELRDEEGYEGSIPTTSRSDRVRNRIYTFGPLAEGETASIEDIPNGLKAVVVTTAASDYPGEGKGPTASGTTDTRTAYLANSLGGEARQLASMNAVNRRYFKR